MNYNGEYRRFLVDNTIIANCKVQYTNTFENNVMNFYERFKFRNLYKTNPKLAFVYYIAINTIKKYTGNSYWFFEHSPVVNKKKNIVIGGGYKFGLNQSRENLEYTYELH